MRSFVSALCVRGDLGGGRLGLVGKWDEGMVYIGDGGEG